MTEKFIQKALFKFWNSHKYKFINIFFFDNESDWLSFLSSGFCYEVEIKVSRSDFFADFKKDRHSIHSNKNAGNQYYIKKYGINTNLKPSWELTAEYPELVTSFERESYRIDGGYEISFSMEISCRIDFFKVQNLSLPNKFFYAVPEGLVKPEEVPPYAGLLYVSDNGTIKKIRDGKFIHKDKLDLDRAFNKAYHVYESTVANQLINI